MDTFETLKKKQFYLKEKKMVIKIRIRFNRKTIRLMH